MDAFLQDLRYAFRSLLRQPAVTSGVVLTLVGIGLLIGLPVAALVGRSMQGLLVATPPVDPLALGGGAAVLLLVATVAAWLPARRAARVDPMEALRSE